MIKGLLAVLAAVAAVRFARFERDRRNVFREANRALGRTASKRG